MFSKRQYRILLLSGMGVFFVIALSIYLFYMTREPKLTSQQPFTNNATVSEDPFKHSLSDEKQIVMAQNLVKIKAETKVVFEIVDQFGMTTKTDSYNGMNWLGYTKVQMSQMFPDYVITKYEKEEVTLTRVIERQVEPSYVLTTQEGNIVIAIERNGHKIFYKETGHGQHDFSQRLGKVLEKGIPITLEQKDAILEDGNELYKILQEYDE